MAKGRIIITGLDGVPYGLLKDLADNGTMPNTGRVIREGAFKRMRSSIPEISSVAWSSIMTGANPAEHGIFGFMDFSPGTYQIRFPNFNDLKKPVFWEAINGKSVIINVPSTYPVRKMDGAHISGFVSVDFEKSVYPKELLPALKKMDYRLDVDSEKAHKSMDLFFSDLDQTLTGRIEAYRYLWDYMDWRLFMLVFTGTDRLMHFLWQAYQDKNHKYHNRFLDYFNRIDRAVGEIFERIDSGKDAFIMLSDHGFGTLEKDVYINYALKKEGFLNFSGPASWDNIDCASKAFALDPARIYVVDPKDKARVLDDLQELFSGLTLDSRKVIRHIYRREDIYSGPFLDEAPDLILIGNDGFDLKAGLKADKLADKGIFTGRHTLDDAFLLLAGSPCKDMMPQSPDVCCVKPIIDKLAKG